jgi:hypothetical protein
MLLKIEGVKMNAKTTKATKAGADLPHGNGEGKGDASEVTKEGGIQVLSVEDIGHSLKKGIVQSLSGLTVIETDIVALVRKTVADTLRTGGVAAGELVNVVHHVVMGAIGAAEQVGIGMTMSVKSVAKGIVMGVNDVGGDVIVASTETIRSVIKHAAAIGADVGMVSRHAVDGMIEATTETGGNLANAGKNMIEGAIKEAGKVSDIAMKSVKDVMNSMLGGLAERDIAHPDAAAHARAAAKNQHAGSGRLEH